MKKLLILALLLISCENEDMSLLSKKRILSVRESVTEPTNPEFEGAFVLSFDDTVYAQTWLDYHNTYGIAQNWKATFFTFRGTTEQNAILKTLSDYGHEIGNHTLSHFNGVNDYMQTHTAEEYYLEHIKPWDDQLVALGIPKPTTFRFPYDYFNYDVIDYLLNSTDFTQVALANMYKFEIVVLNTNIFYNCDQLSISLSIPRAGGAVSLPQIKQCIDYAKANKKAVCFFAHGLGLDPLYVEIIDYVNSIGLPMMTISELNNITPCNREVDLIPPTVNTLSVYSEGNGEVRLTCTANDNIGVVGFDIYVDNIFRYRYYVHEIYKDFPIWWITAGITYNIKVKAVDKYGNTSDFSNTVTATP